MMAEYIAREAVREEMYHNQEALTEYQLDKIPAADVAEMRHARWDDSGRYEFPGGSKAIVCTGCGCALTAGEYLMNKWNFCPVCGARMDGGADNR